MRLFQTRLGAPPSKLVGGGKETPKSELRDNVSKFIFFLYRSKGAIPRKYGGKHLLFVLETFFTATRFFFQTRPARPGVPRLASPCETWARCCCCCCCRCCCCCCCCCPHPRPAVRWVRPQPWVRRPRTASSGMGRPVRPSWPSRRRTGGGLQGKTKRRAGPRWRARSL